LRGFDVELFAATRTGVSEKADLVDQIVKIDDAEPLVREADFVIVAMPLTDATRGLVDSEFLSWMKPTSILVNISRGAVVDEEAVYTALKEKRIHCAALDVWWDYPEMGQRTKYPSDNYPFHELDNVVLSPHRAAYSENVMKNHITFVGENILRFIRGEPLLEVVDMARGY
jgi:phosphoglycerate dehydrogenase-like enzyme